MIFRSEEEANLFYLSLKQKIILSSHLHYTLSEIDAFLEEFNLEKELKQMILNYAEKLINGEKKAYIESNDKNELVKLWYEQYTNFGKKNGNYHYGDLIIFKFQKEEMRKLKKRYSMYMNKEVEKIINDIYTLILENRYIAFYELYLDLLKKFNFNPKKEIQKGHNFGDFLDKRIGKTIILGKFISSLRAIILGGQYYDDIRAYYPFFMIEDFIRKEVEAFLGDRLNHIIREYFPQLLEKNTERIIQSIPKKYTEVRRLLKLPPLNFTIFSYINWEKMDKDSFSDGQARYEYEGGIAKYIINLHPLSLFFCYFNINEFELFIDQLIHHELVHIQQYRFADIYDSYLNNKEFQIDHRQEYLFYKMYAPKLYLDESFPEFVYEILGKRFLDYNEAIEHCKKFKIPKEKIEKIVGSEFLKKKKILSLSEFMNKMGGHTRRFRESMQEFKECRKAMILRGRIETLYASFYYKLWGKTFFKGFWILCDPNRN